MLYDVSLNISKLNTVLSGTICTYSVIVTRMAILLLDFSHNLDFFAKHSFETVFLETKTNLVERNLKLLAGLIHVEYGELVDVRDNGPLQPGLVLVQAVLH